MARIIGTARPNVKFHRRWMPAQSAGNPSTARLDMGGDGGWRRARKVHPHPRFSVFDERKPAVEMRASTYGCEDR